MADELKVQVTLTEPVRVSWPQVFEPKSVVVNGMSKGEPFYSARLVFPADHADIQGLRVTGSQLLAKLKPGLDIKTLRPYEDFFWPFKAGDALIADARRRAAAKGKEYRGFEDYMAGTQTLFVKAAAKYPPQVDVFVNGKWTKVSTDNQSLHRDKFYNGMEASATVTLSGVKLPTGGWGVTAYLQAIGATGTGERLGRQEITHGFMPSVSGSVVNPLADDNLPF